MKQTFVNNFLDSIYEDKKSFIEVFGTEKLFDPKFMLIADIICEHKELLADTIIEAFQAKQEQHLQLNSYSVTPLHTKN